LAPERIEHETLRGAHSQVSSQYHKTNPSGFGIIIYCFVELLLICKINQWLEQSVPNLWDTTSYDPGGSFGNALKSSLHPLKPSMNPSMNSLQENSYLETDF
jgi:hypothetical protein